MLFSLEVTYFTPYFERRSLERGEVINFLLMWDGAVKWRLRCFFAEDDTFLFNFILNQGGWSVKQMSVSVWFIMLGHGEVSEIMWRVILQWLWYNWTAKPLTLKHILTKKIINSRKDYQIQFSFPRGAKNNKHLPIMIWHDIRVFFFVNGILTVP